MMMLLWWVCPQARVHQRILQSLGVLPVQGPVWHPDSAHNPGHHLQLFGILDDWSDTHFRHSCLSDVERAFWCVCISCVGLKASAEAFFIFMFSIFLMSYTATSMTLAISADQTVVGIANIIINMIFLFMTVKKHTHTHTHTHTSMWVYHG